MRLVQLKFIILINFTRYLINDKENTLAILQVFNHISKVNISRCPFCFYSKLPLSSSRQNVYNEPFSCIYGIRPQLIA